MVVPIDYPWPDNVNEIELEKLGIPNFFRLMLIMWNTPPLSMWGDQLCPSYVIAGIKDEIRKDRQRITRR